MNSSYGLFQNYPHNIGFPKNNIKQGKHFNEKTICNTKILSITDYSKIHISNFHLILHRKVFSLLQSFYNV